MINQADNLILQSYYTTILLAELKDKKFVKSDYFQDMSFHQPVIKEALRTIDVDNQGSALMALYAMLVIPKEILREKYASEYNKINEFLTARVTNTETTYPKDSPNIDFLWHIRNSVAHARVEFAPNDYILFRDKDRNRNRFETRLPLRFFGELILKLQVIHDYYVSFRRMEDAKRDKMNPD
jgi:hypothetical protein